MVVPLLRLLLLGSLVAPAALFTFFAWHSYTSTVREAHNRAHRFAAIVQEHALKVFETIGLTLQRVDHEIENLTWDEIEHSPAVWEQVRKIQQSSEQVGAIFVIKGGGETALTTRAYPAPPVNFADRDYHFEQKRADQGLFVGKAYIGKISADPIFNFSIRKSNSRGEFDGVVGVSAFVSYFHTFYESLGEPSDSFAITLIKENGNVLVRYPAVAIGAVHIAADSALLQQLRAQERGTFSAHSQFDAAERLFGHAKLRGFPVHALYSIDRNAIWSEWMTAIAQGAAVTLGIALSLFAACWFALQRARQQQAAIQSLRETKSTLEQEIERRERAEASLMQGQRLEAIGQLTGSIAHDFNNLLMVISGNLELADRRSDLSSVRRLLRPVRYAAERASGLTKQLLIFSRRQMLDPVTIDLNGILEQVGMLVRHSVPSSVHVQFQTASEPCPVRVDVNELEAAILNLTANARHAMPAGGKLIISTRTVGRHAAAARNQHRGELIELCVEDDGAGMPADVLQRVYEPFFTTKPAGQGTGLGLSQVYGFVQQSGGSIEIDSAPEKGTRVRISFPRSSAPCVEVGRRVPSPDRAAKSLTVLIVDDDPEVRRISTAMLDDLGYATLAARSGAEALALIRAGDPIDILFSDVEMMGGMNGVELGKEAVAACPTLKVLLTTGFPGHADLLGEDRFAVLLKPYARAELQAAIASLAADAHSNDVPDQNSQDAGTAV
jgi:two-component system, NtrC family, sensor kinase